MDASNFSLHCCRECLCLFKPRRRWNLVTAARRHSFASPQDGRLGMSLRSGRNTLSEFADLRKLPNKQSSQIHTCNMCDDGSCLSISARYCHSFNRLSVWRRECYLSTLTCVSLNSANCTCPAPSCPGATLLVLLLGL